VLGTTPVQLTAIARSTGEQGGSRNGEGELGSFASPANEAVAGMADDLPREAGAAPLVSRQVAGQIVATAQAMQREEARAPGDIVAKPSAAPVVKVLRLELQPADLGTITIRMSLKQDALDIRVEASRYDTACMLQRDQDGLSKLLTSAGYRIDGMTVVAAPTDGGAVPDGRSQTSLPSSTPQHGGSSHPDSRSSGGRPNAGPNPGSLHGNQNDDNDKSHIARGAGGDRYV
jgi:hypothetical protein